MALLIKGGRLVDPASSMDALRDVRIREGAIAEIGADLAPRDDEAVLDVAGAVVAQRTSWTCDAYSRDTGLSRRRRSSGTEAAVRGGFTTVACMPNTASPAARRCRNLERPAARNRAAGSMPGVSDTPTITRSRKRRAAM